MKMKRITNITNVFYQTLAGSPPWRPYYVCVLKILKLL